MNRFLRGIRRPHLLCNYLIKKMSWLFTDKMYLRLRFYCELGIGWILIIQRLLVRNFNGSNYMIVDLNIQ